MRKGELSNIGTICNVLIELADICNVLPKTVDYNGFMVVKLKLIKNRSYVYFELVHPCDTYQATDYLKSHNNFYEGISISKGLSSNEMSRFSTMEPVEV